MVGINATIWPRRAELSLTPPKYQALTGSDTVHQKVVFVDPPNRAACFHHTDIPRFSNVSSLAFTSKAYKSLPVSYKHVILASGQSCHLRRLALCRHAGCEFYHFYKPWTMPVGRFMKLSFLSCVLQRCTVSGEKFSIHHGLNEPYCYQCP